MTTIESEIIEMYENLDMPTEEIALAVELDNITVKTILAQHSVKYRNNGRKLATIESKDVKVSHSNPKAPSPTNKVTNFLSPEEQETLRDVMVSLAIDSENDAVRAKMSIYLFEENKGRNEARIRNLSNMKPNGVNILVLNQRLVQTQAKIETLRQRSQQIKDKEGSIEVESVKT